MNAITGFAEVFRIATVSSTIVGTVFGAGMFLYDSKHEDSHIKFPRTFTNLFVYTVAGASVGAVFPFAILASPAIYPFAKLYTYYKSE